MLDDEPLYYLAYGSNLHPLRLELRLTESRLLARVQLPGCRLCFHKRGEDGSGKCTLLREPGQMSYGALYRLGPGQQEELDRWEGGYDRHRVQIELAGQTICATTYLAQPQNLDAGLDPYHWYRDLVRAGAEHLDFPRNHLKVLKGIKGCTDRNQARDALHQRLLQQLQARNHSTPPPSLATGTLVGWF